MGAVRQVQQVAEGKGLDRGPMSIQLSAVMKCRRAKVTLYPLQVPFTLKEEDTPDDWECSNNEWDKAHASCTVPQALSDEEIDEILAQQVVIYSCLVLKTTAPLTSGPVSFHLFKSTADCVVMLVDAHTLSCGWM